MLHFGVPRAVRRAPRRVRCRALLWCVLIFFLYSKLHPTRRRATPGLWLGCTLAVLGLLAIPLTAGTVLAYLFLRFAFIARREGSPRAALSQWAQETKGQFIKRPLEGDDDGQPEAVTLVVGSIVLDGSTPMGEDKREEDSVQPDGILTEEVVKVEGSPQAYHGSF